MAAEYGSDAVLFYARQGDIDEVKRLVAENRSMANYTHVVTPLMWASYMGHCALANYLLDHGARVNQVEMGKGRTALYLAAGRGHSSMVSLLLKRGADPTIRRSGGWDALSVAASEAHIEVVQLLLDEAGVYVDGADTDGCTALHRASAWGRTDVVRLLLRRGADWRRVTHHKTALDMARDRHRAGCIAVLEDAERAYELTRARRMYQESSMIRTAISGATTPTPTTLTTTTSTSSTPTSAPTFTSSVSISSVSSVTSNSSSSSSSSSSSAAAAAVTEAAAAPVCAPAGGIPEATYTHTHTHPHTHTYAHTHTHRHTHIPFSFHHHRLYGNAHTHNTHVCCKGVCARSVTHPDDVVEWLRKRIEHHHQLPHVHIDDPVKPPQGKTGFWSKLLTGLSAVTSAKLSHIASASSLQASTLNHDPPSAAEEMCAFASAANNHSNSHNNHHRPPHHINNHTAHHSNNIINNAMAGASSPASVLPCVLAAATFSPAAGGGGSSPTHAHAHAHTGSVCAGRSYNSAAGVAPTALYVVTQMKYDVVTQLMDFFV